ncbi:MAG: RagB/SusD family nutrient uptake outer membrane protein [Tannerella sp.]|jgi:hypothetical protein|nr:RagB/SusD family nutrient uptake outer membrane protein [Tannerella sp.]
MKTVYYWTFLLLIGCTFFSCSDLLDEDPSHIGTSDTYFPTKNGFEGAVNACYAQLRNMHNNKQMWLQGTDQFQRDTWYSPSSTTTFNSFNDYSPAALNAEASVINDFWNKAWIGISRCNIVLGLATEVDVDEQTKGKRMAEVKTLRALYYYYLVEQYGDIPFPLEPYEELQTTAERTSEETVYGQLIRDLEESVPVLPDNPDNFGRITKGAAQFLLAKLYLTRGYKDYGHSDDFLSAAGHADNLIKSGTFELLPQFHMIFMPGNEKNREVIFSVQYSNDLILNGDGNNMHSRFGLYANNYTGAILSNYYNASSLTFFETYHTLDCFGVDTANNPGKSYVSPKQMAGRSAVPPPREYSFKVDKRYNATFQRLWMTEVTRLNFKKTQGVEREQTWNLYAKTDGQNGEVTPIVWAGIEEYLNVNYWFGAGRDTCLYVPAPDETEEWPLERINSVPYSVPTYNYWVNIPEWGEMAKPALKKFREPQPGYNYSRGIRDMFLFRLGEAYLIAAEAYYKAGNVSEAVTRINTIRRRAYGAGENTPCMMDITEADLDIDFILDERTRELAGEEHRWVELKRTGRLIERVLKYNLYAGSDYIVGGPHIKPYHYLRPIPWAWISLLRNEVSQNPGYAREQ